MILQELFDEQLAAGYETDKGTAHSYIPFYEEVLKPYYEAQPINLLEIGIGNGQSLMLWRSYFSHRASHIFGIDKNQADERVHGDWFEIIEDATNPKAYEWLPAMDIIIDDGSHYVEEIIKTFLLAKHLLKSNGIYIIEDIQDDTVIKEIESVAYFQIVDRRKYGQYDDRLGVWKTWHEKKQ